MTTTTAVATYAAPTGFRRVAPALALFFVSPFVAEFLLGDFSINVFGLILFVAPMYGAGAIVIRETARRLGRGWPTMLRLALAYGLLEEGIVIQTLFNPNYLGFHLLARGWVPGLGIGVWWTFFVLTIHTVWSISVPIALVEGMAGNRRTKPWLGNIGLGVALLLLAAGSVLIHRFTRKHDPFAASAAQLTTVWALIVALVFLALRRGAAGASRPARAPSAWAAGVVALVLGIAFMRADRVFHGWPSAGVQIALDLAAIGLLLAYSRRTGWTPLHTLAVAGGALLTYACTAFGQDPVAGGKGTIALVSHIVFAAIAVVLLALALNQQRKLAACAG